MSEPQLGLFDVLVERTPVEEYADACLLGHGPSFICPACAACGDTDGCGFLHRQVCQGRIPLRACRGCGALKTHGGWSHTTYWWCLECKPLGVSDAG